MTMARRAGLGQTTSSSSSMKLSPNFELKEFASRGTDVPVWLLPNVIRLAQNLQRLRDAIGKPVRINSGYRTAQHNASVGGAKSSQHLSAGGADITVKGVTPAQVYCTIERLIAEGRMQQGGLGLYKGHVHYDVRPKRTRWLGGGVTLPDCSRVATSSTTVPASAATKPAPATATSTRPAVPSGRIRPAKKHGYKAYGGPFLDDWIRQAVKEGIVSATPALIDTLQRIANVETGGRIQAINSWDSGYMSMGFMQLTITHDKLQRLIARAPIAFRRYGIELEPQRRYTIGKYTPRAIKGAAAARDLRSPEWAERFFAAGFDPEIIAAQVDLAREILTDDINRIRKNAGSDWLRHYERSAALRGLVHETFNNRPAYLYVAMQRALARERTAGGATVDRFHELLGDAIREVYTEKEGANGTTKARNLIHKTGRIRL